MECGIRIHTSKEGIMSPEDVWKANRAIHDASPADLDALAKSIDSQPPDRQEAFWLDVMSSPETVTDTLRAIIGIRKLTSYRLAELSGLHSTAIQRFVNGERGLSLASIQKLAKALGLGLKLGRLDEPVKKKRKPPKTKK
jgi:Helix-turn-helix